MQVPLNGALVWSANVFGETPKTSGETPALPLFRLHRSNQSDQSKHFSLVTAKPAPNDIDLVAVLRPGQDFERDLPMSELRGDAMKSDARWRTKGLQLIPNAS